MRIGLSTSVIQRGRSGVGQYVLALVRALLAQDIQRFFGIPASRITTVPNGLDHARFSPGDRHAASQFVAQRYQLRPPFFLFVSRLEHPAKNHVRLIEAFKGGA